MCYRKCYVVTGGWRVTIVMLLIRTGLIPVWEKEIGGCVLLFLRGVVQRQHAARKGDAFRQHLNQVPRELVRRMV